MTLDNEGHLHGEPVCAGWLDHNSFVDIVLDSGGIGGRIMHNGEGPGGVLCLGPLTLPSSWFSLAPWRTSLRRQVKTLVALR